MAHQEYRFDAPERFVAGTVGEPGERSFFLQARQGGKLASVLLEKEQVAALADRIDQLLDEVVRRSGGAAAVPPEPPAVLTDNDPLEVPIESEFRVGTMTLAWDGEDGLVVIEAFAADEPATAGDSDGEDGPADRSVLVVRLKAPHARAFVQRAQAVVSAGRPPCPLCGLPLDAEGHVCPRKNGYRRRGVE